MACIANPNLADPSPVYLVVGAAGGIGNAITERHRGAGGRVMAVDLVSPRGIEAEDTVLGDVCDEAVVVKAIDRAMARHGRIDAVVHSVGMTCAGPATALSIEAWRRVMDVNLTSAFLVARHAYPALLSSGGSLVFIASSSARNGGTTATGPAYAASKAGLLNLARYLAREWAPSVRVNCVAPGPVLTPMIEAVGPERQAAYAASMLTGRLAHADEIAACVAFLTSADARSMTAAVLNPSGGLVFD